MQPKQAWLINGRRRYLPLEEFYALKGKKLEVKILIDPWEAKAFSCPQEFLDLDFQGLKIPRLPDNLTIFGNLNLRRSSLLKLPQNLTVKGFLRLEDTDITELPEGLTVGMLNLSKTKITKLPADLVVTRDLYLPRTIRKIPATIQVGGKIIYPPKKFGTHWGDTYWRDFSKNKAPVLKFNDYKEMQKYPTQDFKRSNRGDFFLFPKT